MKIVTLDFETYYSREYSLSKMREYEYVLDARFEIIMCAIKEGDGPNRLVVGHENVVRELRAIDWTQCAALSHNMRFDGAILNWIVGVSPRLYLDTLSMARALTHAKIGRSSLAAIARYFGFPDKGTAVTRAIGKRLADFTPDELAEYGDYCLHDNDLCWQAFRRFMRAFPKAELLLVDMVIRMYVEPQVVLDAEKLQAHLTKVQTEQAALFQRVAHVDKTTLSSSKKFAALLEAEGVSVPHKYNDKGELIPALAKNDREFKEMCDDDTLPPMVQALLAARVGAKSTIEETRTAALLKLARQDWSAVGRGWTPIPLKYSGAHTHRLSGDGGFNFQNLKRGSPIKDAIEAPPGYRILHRDASQIEARMVAFLARCQKLLDAFAQGRDVYSEFATVVYGRKITKADKLERFVGKTGILGLGYQTGGEKLQHTLFIGNGGVSVKIEVAAAHNIVRLYRSEYSEIPDLWASCELMLDQMIDMGGERGPGGRQPTNAQRARNAGLRPVPVVEVSADGVWLPNGLCIAYPNLRWDTLWDKHQRVYDGPYGPKNIYGGKATENISQALSRIIVLDIAVRVFRETGVWPWLSTHDSLDYCIPEDEAPAWDALLEREFARRPVWAPELPLASEGGWGRTLAEAERALNA